MRTQTFLEAYKLTQEDKEVAIAKRKERNWGIMVDGDYWAKFYQKRHRQGEKFLRAIHIRLTEIENLLTTCKEILDWMKNADISYANGVTHGPYDEGEVRGWEIHKKLEKQFEAAITKLGSL